MGCNDTKVNSEDIDMFVSALVMPEFESILGPCHPGLGPGSDLSKWYRSL